MNMPVRVEGGALAQQTAPMNATQVVAQVRLIQEVMEAVMKNGTHYGTIPGTPKPSLWKPGAEVLCATFRIAPSYQTEDLSTADSVRYRVCCVGKHQLTGIVLGEGLGECSSNEEKYKWRKATNKEFEATPVDRRRTKYARGTNGEYEVKQVRTEPADVANTILKMACKRAQVAMSLNVTAASDIFTQDLEDLPDELQQEATETRAPIQQPQSTAQPTQQQEAQAQRSEAPKNTSPIGPGQIRVLIAKIKGKNKTAADLCAHFKIETKGESGLEALTMDLVNDAMKWVDA